MVCSWEFVRKIGFSDSFIGTLNHCNKVWQMTFCIEFHKKCGQKCMSCINEDPSLCITLPAWPKTFKPPFPHAVSFWHTCSREPLNTLLQMEEYFCIFAFKVICCRFILDAHFEQFLLLSHYHIVFNSRLLQRCQKAAVHVFSKGLRESFLKHVD